MYILSGLEQKKIIKYSASPLLSDERRGTVTTDLKRTVNPVVFSLFSFQIRKKNLEVQHSERWLTTGLVFFILSVDLSGIICKYENAQRPEGEYTAAITVIDIHRPFI